MTNFDLSQKVFDFLTQAQVQTVVVCAGARNAALVMALGSTSFQVVQFFEERSAAFFALGLMKSSGRPVAVLTTSGTAVAELLPAAIEATYQALPLILISADRPKSYRGSGAPQTIDQVRIFSDYVEQVYDLDVHSKDFSFEWSFQKPIQLNICFDEPLIDQASKETTPSVSVKCSSSFARPSTIRPIQNPLVIVGELHPEEVSLVKNFLLRTQCLVYAEALSQLVGDSDLCSQMIVSSDLLVKKYFQQKYFDSVIRIGGIPTLRFWRDLESTFLSVPVFNFSSRSYSGLARSSMNFPIQELAEIQIENQSESFQAIKAKDLSLQKQKFELFEKYPLSEPACVKHFSQQVGSAPLYLGNSLPIRHWDSFSINHSQSLYGNRGANGIDGQISTYLGWSERYKTSYCLVGDLTALYDLAALGLTSQLQESKRRVVIMNNFGGQIFQRVLKNKLFINAHQIQFQSWAQMWGWDYLLIKSVGDFQKLAQDNSLCSVVEIQPDTEQTKLFWNEWDLLCQKI